MVGARGNDLKGEMTRERERRERGRPAETSKSKSCVVLLVKDVAQSMVGGQERLSVH